MKQFTTCANVANRFFKVLQGYTKGIRFTAILTLLFTIGVGQVWAATETLSCSAGTISNNTMTFSTTNFTFVHAKGNGSSFASYSPWRVYAKNTVTITAGSGVASIDKIEVVHNSTYYGTISSSSGTVTMASSTGGTTTINFTSGKTVTLTNIATSQSRWSSIKITYTAASSCDKKVTVNKGTPSNGSFSISKTGTYETCGEALVITLSNINPSTGYQFDEITQSGINTGVTIDQANKKVTYAQNTSGTSTINVTFNALPTHTVTWIVNGNEYTEGTPTASVYEGAKWSSLTLPTAPNPNNYCGQVFAGWTTTNIGSTGLDKDNDATAIQNLNLMTSENKSSKTNTITEPTTFYAVFADYAD